MDEPTAEWGQFSARLSRFAERFVEELRKSPPQLPGNTITEKALGDWVAQRFSLDELQLLRELEDQYGSENADEYILALFARAGLPVPNPR